MRSKFLLYPCIFLMFILGYSCKKSTDAAPNDPASGDTTKPVPPVFKLSRTVVELGNGIGHTDTFYVKSEVSWTVSLSAGDNGWLLAEVVKDASGKSGTVKLSVITATVSPKTAVITITPADTSVAPLQVTVKQKTYSLTWQKCYGGSADDYFYGTVQLANGQFVSSGITQSADGDALGNAGAYKGWVVNTDAGGNRIWNASFGGTVSASYSSVAATTDGGTINVGYTYISGKDYEGWVTKIDAQGKLVWEKTFGGLYDDYANQVLATTDGGAIVSGHTNSDDRDSKGNHGLSDLWVIKLDANGNVAWLKMYGGAGKDSYGVITASSDGGYILSGTTESNNSGDVPATKGSSDMLVIKIDANGNKIWSKTFGGSDYDGVYSVSGDADGGCTVAGLTVSNNGDVVGFHGGFLEDAWVLKIDGNGQLKWQATLGGTQADFATGILQLPNGNTFVACMTDSNDGDVSGNHGLSDIWLVELNSQGKKVWQKAFGSNDYDAVLNLHLIKSGEILVTGFTAGNNGDVSGNHGKNDGWLFKLK